MDPAFWHTKWSRNEIGFHEGRPNALLVKHLPRLALRPQARIFVPMCGKSQDIEWLMAQGFRVAGVELSPIAVAQLFSDLGLDPRITPIERLARYSARGIDIFVGDVFDLSADILGSVDAVYDRAALVALPRQMRRRYAAHLIEITSAVPQLLICFAYDQSLRAGPPFSVNDEEIRELYAEFHDPLLLETVAVRGGLKGLVDARETVWLLERR